MSVIEREQVSAPPVTTRDVLHRAADLLEEFGHCKGQLGSKQAGGFCWSGAIKEACSDLGLHVEETFSSTNAWSQTLLHMGGNPLGAIEMVEWNNRPSTTKEEVVARLRAAADASV